MSIKHSITSIVTANVPKAGMAKAGRVIGTNIAARPENAISNNCGMERKARKLAGY